MNQETGTVIGTSTGRVTVRIDRDATCAGCHSCLVDESQGALVATARDPLNAHVGDRVVLEERSRHGGKSSSGRAGLLLFGLPLLAFVPGYVGGQAVGRALGLASPESLAVVGGLVGFAIPLLVLYLLNRRRSRGAVGFMEVVGILHGRRQ